MTPQNLLLGSAINPLTGMPYNWTKQDSYGSLDDSLFGWEWTVPGGDGSSHVQHVYGQLETDPSKGYGGDSGSDGGQVFDLQTAQMLGDKFGKQGFTYGWEDDGRMQRTVVYDKSGNVVWGTEPQYRTPDNFWKDAFLPMAAFAIGAPMLGSAMGIPIPAGTPTLGGLLGGGAAEGGAVGAAEAGASGASSVTPEMLAAANATADPIAALNASAGWTGADSAYLAGIGAAAPETTSAVSQNMINAANETLDPIAALNNSAGWTGVDKAYLASIGLPELGGAMAGLGGPAIGVEQLPAIAMPNLGANLPPMSVPGGSLLDTKTPPAVKAPESPSAVVPGAASSIPDWLKENGKWLAPLLGAGMGLLDGGGSSSGGYKDSGYRPTITRGGWSPSAGKAPTVTPNIGLLNIPTTGVENAGLWRFLGGK